MVKFPKKKGQGAPPRDAADPEVQKAMMSYYFKKQEEHQVQLIPFLFYFHFF